MTRLAGRQFERAPAAPAARSPTACSARSSEADDAVQEAWLRLEPRRRRARSTNLGGWLTTVVGRVCLDMLRARRARREDYVGTWLPEPVVSSTTRPDPSSEAVLADSVGLALLVVLDTLTPAERLAFVLHDMFGMPFDEIAPIVGRSPDAARQLASRARRRVRGAAPGPSRPGAAAPDRRRVPRRRPRRRLRGAARVLDPDVVLRSTPAPGVGGRGPRRRGGRRRPSGFSRGAPAWPARAPGARQRQRRASLVGAGGGRSPSSASRLARAASWGSKWSPIRTS